MALTTDARTEEMQVELNRTLFFNYGNNLVLSQLKEEGLNKYDVKLDYNKIFHIIDEKSNTIFVRNIKFNKVFETSLKYGDKLQLPLDEINSAINTEFAQIRNSIILKVLSRRDLVLSLIRNAHIFTAYLNKFYTILNQLITSKIFYKSQIDEHIFRNENFEKYIAVVVEEGLAEYDGSKNLKASNKLKMIFKEQKEMKKAVDEALYLIIKNHYDYIVYELNIRTLQTYVNIVSCFLYLVEYHKLGNINITKESFFKVFQTFYDNVKFDKFLERINNLVYSKVFFDGDKYITLNPQFI